MSYRCDSPLPGHRLAEAVFSGEDGLACLCREKDWSHTPLGPVDAWPASLRMAAALVVAAPVPMVLLWGPQLVQIYNDGYCKILGGKHPAGLGQPTRACWPEVWDFNAPLYDGVMTRRASFAFEDHPFMLERHGYPEQAYFTVAYSPVLDDQCAVGGVLVTATETTAAMARQQAGALVAEADERLRVALEAADLGTWDLDLTTDTSAVRSLRHDQIFGYATQQAQWGQEIATRHVLPDDRPILQQAFARAATTGVLSCEVRVRWPDGSIHWIAPLGRTCYDSTGRPVRMAGVVADVTQRNEAQALRRSEERFRLMADSVPQIVWITDAAGRVEFFNQQWSDYTGLAYQPETAADVAAAVVHPDDAAPYMAKFEEAQRTATAFLTEHRVRSAAGAYRWFLVRAEPYRDPHTGEITRWFGASVDIHDRKLAEDALRQADHRKDVFLAMLAHELRNPLAPIAAAADLLTLGRVDEARIRQTSAIITRQVRHMTGLVDDLLDVSRVTRGLVQLDQATLDAKKIVIDAVEQVRPLIEARRHRLAIHTPPEEAFVRGDIKRLVQVMANLLNNAAKYTPEGGEIVLALEVDGSHVKLAISDNGMGIAPALQPTVFDLFTQADRASDRSQGGLGIGLALVKSLVALHGGHITVHSEGAGRGSRFVVCLPHVEVAADAQLAERRTIAAAATGRVRKVLVVDDNTDAAQMLGMLVEELGHEVFIEHHPRRALETARTAMPDVCLLDIGLPDMDGNELARRLR
ncbi:MAG TPA: ATP-binding protein, partial [Telluria sp.]